MANSDYGGSGKGTPPTMSVHDDKFGADGPPNHVLGALFMRYLFRSLPYFLGGGGAVALGARLASCLHLG